MPVSCAHFQALVSGAGLAERNAEFGPGRGREDLSAASTVVLHRKVTAVPMLTCCSLQERSLSCTTMQKKNHLPDFCCRVCKQEEY